MEDDRPRPKPLIATIGADLSALSIDDLKARVADLRGEIARTEAEIDKKQAQTAAAAAFFK
ncbi:MAG: DUF1192 family protein [Bdellovibrionales bacterium]